MRVLMRAGGEPTRQRDPSRDLTKDTDQMRSRRTRGALILAAGVVLFAVAAQGIDATLAAGGRAASPPTVAAQEPVLAAVDPDGLADGIAQAQQRLEEVPGDWDTWAALGIAQVEQARVTADPAWYPRAEGALETSLELRPDNDDAMAGMGALANARHDFEAAERWADQALEVNPSSATAWGILTDARIQLGDYDGATAAAQQMVDLRPGLASLTRVAYDRELHGEVEGARSALERALSMSSSSSGRSWIQTHLGLLAVSTGDLDEARRQFMVGLEAVPDDPTLRAGLARVDAAEGDVDAAVAGWESVVARRPLPEYLAEYGTYLLSLGRDEAAREQFAVVDAVQEVFAAEGVADDLTGAYLAADLGDAEAAVAHAEAERSRRANVESADALAWALHVAGRHAEALPLAEEATALRGRNALYLYHRGMIEQALGMDDAALDHLSAALDTNPWFSPLHAPRAETARAELLATR